MPKSLRSVGKFRFSSARSSGCALGSGRQAAQRERLPQSAWAGLLVRPETVLGWHRALVRRKWAAYRGRPRRGRPPISAQCRRLIVRMAKENPGWGYVRIRGELLKIGHTVAATTIHSVLLGAGIPPSGRRARLTWKQFLAAHAETLVAADFFSVDVAQLAASGSTTKEITTKLGVGERTVETHLAHIYAKLGVSGRHDLALRGLVEQRPG